MAFCTKCGKAVEEGSAFCSGCGAAIDLAPLENVAPVNEQIQPEPVETAPVEEASAEIASAEETAPEASETVQEVEPEITPVEEVVKEEPQQPKTVEPQPQYQVPPQYQAQPQYQPQPNTYLAPVYKEEPVTMGTFFGLEFLYRIPVLGLLVALFIAFIPKSRSLKNHARAAIVWQIITIGILVGLFFIGKAFYEAFVESIEDINNTSIKTLEDLIEEIERITNCEIEIG